MRLLRTVLPSLALLGVIVLVRRCRRVRSLVSTIRSSTASRGATSALQDRRVDDRHRPCPRRRSPRTSTRSYVGTRNGGVWKTTNKGRRSSRCSTPSRRFRLARSRWRRPTRRRSGWAPARPTRPGVRTPGDGVYKSADAGRTWTNMGLRESHHVSRILIHPKNPNVVYVGRWAIFTRATRSAGSS